MDCDVIRDLMPLYADELLSNSSRKLVENHNKTCPECRELLENMCAPMEPEPADKNQAYIDAIHSQKRKTRRRTILACVLTVLLCFIAWWLYMETHFYGEKIVTVSTDEEVILKEMPDLALTDAEKELANAILEVSQFRDVLSDDPYSFTVFEPEDVRKYFSSVLPDDAVIGEIGIIHATVHIDYREGDMRTILEYTDADLTGHVDVIRKYMADSPRESIAGAEFAGDVDEVFMLTYAVGSGITRYEKTESQHMWFSFLDMP